MLATLAMLLVTQGPNTLSELVCSVKSAAPGSKISVALRIKHAPGWHTYFVNPGGAGFPATVNWTLPAGVTAGPIQWPVPHREVWQDETTYLYDGDLYMPMTIAIPANWKAGKKLSLTAKAAWLTCSESCVRQSADLKIEIATSAKETPNPAYAKAVAASGYVYPQAGASGASAKGSGKSIQLDAGTLLEPGTTLDFFSTDQDNFGAAAPKPIDRGLLIPLGPDAKKVPASLKGILAVLKDGKPVRAWTLDVPVQP